MTTVKPGRGNPKTPEQIAAVAAMEQEVVTRAANGQSFYRIERELGITNAGRIFKRVTASMERSRENAYALESMRLDTLTEKAHEALAADGLEHLAERLADLLSGADMDDEGLPDRIRNVITRAYADTYKAIPVALQVHDRRVRLDGLDHAARIADGNLAVAQAQVQMMGVALGDSLGLLDVEPEQKAAVIAAFVARMKTTDTPEG